MCSGSGKKKRKSCQLTLSADSTVKQGVGDPSSPSLSCLSADSEMFDAMLGDCHALTPSEQPSQTAGDKHANGNGVGSEMSHGGSGSDTCA